MPASTKKRSPATTKTKKTPSATRKSGKPSQAARKPAKRASSARGAKGTLTVSQFMQKDVVTASDRDTLADVMALMSEHHVSGLPVTDAKNCCLGVVAMSDVLDFVESQQEELAGAHDASGRIYNRDSEEWDSARLSAASMDEYGSTPVTEIMTGDVVSVPPTATLSEVAKLMVKRNVHRVLVLDTTKHLLGLASAFDLVRVLATKKID